MIAQWKIALEQARNAPRCGARTRLRGTCQSPAMRNGRCRMHGGKSFGAPQGPAHGKFKQGLYTKESLAFYKGVREQLKNTQEIISE